MLKILTSLFFHLSVLALIGGEQTYEKPYNSQVRFADLCTATYLGEGTFLTAAHCFYDERGRELQELKVRKRISIKIYNGKTKTYKTRIKKVEIHPSYKALISKNRSREKSARHAQDIAVLFTNFNSQTSIATINYELPQIGQNITMAGTGCEKKKKPGRLKIGNSIITSTSLLTNTGKKILLSDTEKSELCPGDSGGGLYMMDEIIGVNSAKARLDGSLVNIYHSTFEARSWLQSILKK